MPKLSELLREDELAEEVAAGRVKRTRHPELPLSIYAYGPRCVFDNHWTDVTRRTRGLIVDDDTSDVVAVPFPKFFNADQHAAGSPFAGPLPVDEAFEVQEKIDGSLAIVFHYAGRWHAATKSSFRSDQARWAQAWLDARDTSALSPGTTYLAEIVFPANRIVVDNGARETLVLLGGYGPDTAETPLADLAPAWRALGGDIVRTHTTTLADLLDHAANNRSIDGRSVSGTDAEGWVVRYSSGLRVKIKTRDYLRLHATLTRTTERSVWEHLSTGGDPAALFDRMPDEFRTWILAVATRLHAEQQAWQATVQAAFDTIGPVADRRTFAQHVQAHPRGHRSALFLLHDGRPIDDLAWRVVKPPPGDPYRIPEIG